jgi:hypothetical protein
MTGGSGSQPPLVRRQALLLRWGAFVELLALPWAVLPRSWMEHSHEWLGMGPMPSGAVVDFTIRQSALFYGMHGVLMWRVSLDVLRFQPLVRLLGWTWLFFGPAFLVINLWAGTPTWWAICDPLATGGFGVWLLVNDSRISRQTAQSVPAPPPAFSHGSELRRLQNHLDS